MSKDMKNILLQADEKIYQWKVGIDDMDEVDEFKNCKKLFKSPSVDSKLYTGSTDKTFKEVMYDGADASWSTLRQLRCKEQVTKIAVNDDDTIAYVCCGAQNLYRINLQDFTIGDEMVENLTGVCHNLLIQKLDQEYLFLCGKNNLFSKYEVKSGLKTDELKGI